MNKVIIIIILTMQLIAFVVTLTDKKRAIKRKRRISEKRLFLVALFFGAPAMFLTMVSIRHKTNHLKFMIFLPLLILLQTLIVLLLLKHNII